ncbi:MAG: hypothetical protein EBR73_16745, partial [Rhodobacteraceae bacterium]|nr:hypothetical protein [Paracoccaceae bacterium]
LNQNFAAQLPAIQTQLGQYGQVAGAPNLAAYGTAGAPGAGDFGTVSGAPSAAQYGPRSTFTAEAMPGMYAPIGQAQQGIGAFGDVAQAPDLTGMGQAGGNVALTGFTGGPSGGQFGMAGGGPAAYNLGQLDLSGVGGVGGGPAMGQYGMAQAGPGGVQFGGLDLSGLGTAQGFGNVGQYAAGAGPNAPNVQGADFSRVGQIGPGVGYGQFGMAGGGPAAGLFGLAGAGRAAPQLGGLNLANVGTAQAGVSPTQFGMAAGGPAGVQFGGLNLAGMQGVQGGVGQFGQAQGGPAGLNLGGFDTSRLGEIAGGPSADQFGRAIGGPAAPSLQESLNLSGVGDVARNVQEGRFGYARGELATPELQRQLATQGLAAMPVNAGMTAQNAIMSRLEPQLQRERAQLEQRLVNQGLRPGGEAYNAEMELQAQRENDLRTQAALQGISLDASMRQQGLAEQQTLADFANQAALAQFGAGAQGLGLYNEALAQNFQQSLAAQSAQNMAQQQAFQQRLQA